MKLQTGQWGTPHYSQPATEERRLYGVIGHIKHWKPCLGALIRYFGTNNHLLICALCVILPNGQWGTPITSNRPLRNRQLYAVIRRIKHWKQCLGAPMCYFGTNGPLLIYALCVILPTGHWGTPHYSQPATEEWLHLTAIWGTWNTIKHWKPSRGTLMRYFGTNNRLLIHYVWYSQPASEECPIIPNRPLRNGCICQQYEARETQ